MLAYSFTMVLHSKCQKKKNQEAGRKLILRRDLNLRPSEDNSDA